MMSNLANNFTNSITEVFEAKTEEEMARVLADCSWDTTQSDYLMLLAEYLREHDSWMVRGVKPAKLASVVQAKLANWQKKYGKIVVPDAAINEISLELGGAESDNFKAALSKKRAAQYFLIKWWAGQIQGYHEAKSVNKKINALLDTEAFKVSRVGGSNRFSNIYIKAGQEFLQRKITEAEHLAGQVPIKITQQKHEILKEFNFALKNGLTMLMQGKLAEILPSAIGLEKDYLALMNKIKNLGEHKVTLKNKIECIQTKLHSMRQELYSLTHPIISADKAGAQGFEIAAKQHIFMEVPKGMLPEGIACDKKFTLSAVQYCCYPELRKKDYEAFYKSKGLELDKELDISFVKTWVSYLIGQKKHTIQQLEAESNQNKIMLERAQAELLKTECDKKIGLTTIQNVIADASEDKKLIAKMWVEHVLNPRSSFGVEDIATVIDQFSPESINLITQQVYAQCHAKGHDFMFPELAYFLAKFKEQAVSTLTRPNQAVSLVMAEHHRNSDSQNIASNLLKIA